MAMTAAENLVAALQEKHRLILFAGNMEYTKGKMTSSSCLLLTYFFCLGNDMNKINGVTKMNHESTCPYFTFSTRGTTDSLRIV